jgi:hypothetical protein
MPTTVVADCQARGRPTGRLPAAPGRCTVFRLGHGVSLLVLILVVFTNLVSAKPTQSLYKWSPCKHDKGDGRQSAAQTKRCKSIFASTNAPSLQVSGWPSSRPIDRPRQAGLQAGLRRRSTRSNTCCVHKRWVYSVPKLREKEGVKYELKKLRGKTRSK